MLWTANVIIKGTVVRRCNKSSLTKLLPGELMQYFHSCFCNIFLSFFQEFLFTIAFAISFLNFFLSRNASSLKLNQAIAKQHQNVSVCQSSFNMNGQNCGAIENVANLFCPPVQCGLQCGRTIRGVSQH